MREMRICPYVFLILLKNWFVEANLCVEKHSLYTLSSLFNVTHINMWLYCDIISKAFKWYTLSSSDSNSSLRVATGETSSPPPAILCSFFVPPPPPIVTYRLLSLCLLSRGATAGKGSLREALSNNDQPVDLYTVTLSFHTLSKAAIMAGEGLRLGGKLQAGQGMPSIKIDLHYSEFSTNSFKEQGIISS